MQGCQGVANISADDRRGKDIQRLKMDSPGIRDLLETVSRQHKIQLALLLLYIREDTSKYEEQGEWDSRRNSHYQTKRERDGEYEKDDGP